MAEAKHTRRAAQAPASTSHLTSEQSAALDFHSLHGEFRDWQSTLSCARITLFGVAAIDSDEDGAKARNVVAMCENHFDRLLGRLEEWHLARRPSGAPRADRKDDGESVIALPSSDHEVPEERDCARIRAFLAAVVPLNGCSGNEARFWAARARIERLALAREVDDDDYSWSAEECAEVLGFFSWIEPLPGRCVCNDEESPNATCGVHLIMNFMAEQVRRVGGPVLDEFDAEVPHA